MPKSKSDMIATGKTKYTKGVKAIGGAKEYFRCGAEGGMDTAVCLSALRGTLTEEDWADKWETAMQGR